MCLARIEAVRVGRWRTVDAAATPESGSHTHAFLPGIRSLFRQAAFDQFEPL
jgi:hypothetical protein